MLRNSRPRLRPVLFYAVPAVCVVALASAIHPYGAQKKLHTREHTLEIVITDYRAAAIVARSCANCHSDKTKWPWYSYVPPASWLVERDVAEARAMLNLSAWQSYTSEKKARMLADIARVVANREMPLRRYLMLHKFARLSDQDAHVLIKWAGRERRSFRIGVPGDTLPTLHEGSR